MHSHLSAFYNSLVGTWKCALYLHYSQCLTLHYKPRWWWLGIEKGASQELGFKSYSFHMRELLVGKLEMCFHFLFYYLSKFSNQLWLMGCVADICWGNQLILATCKWQVTTSRALLRPSWAVKTKILMVNCKTKSDGLLRDLSKTKKSKLLLFSLVKQTLVLY